MNAKLREYIDTLFESAPQTKKTVEVKEEILQNLIDKYNDLIAEGKSEEAAYNIAVASVGDISALIDDLNEEADAKQDSVDNEAYLKNKERRALMTSIAIGLYIISFVPCIIFRGSLGPVLMFVMWGIATALLIYKSMTKSNYAPVKDGTMAEEFKEWRKTNSEKKQLYKAINSAIWAITIVIYILISFWTGAWHITWVIFLITVAINGIVKALFDYKK